MKAEKHCPDCRQALPISEFTKNARERDGLAFYCTPCRRAREAVSRYKRNGLPQKRMAPPNVAEGSKWCPECDTIKPLIEFAVNRSQPSGNGSYCKPCHNRITRGDKTKNHGSARNYHLKRRYGITAEQFDRMFAEQGGVCAICEEAPAAHVDHDHETGRVRGLLCFNCNGALGQFRDRTDLMVKAVAYLEPALYGPAIAAGATLSTHLYIGPPLDPRAPEPVGR